MRISPEEVGYWSFRLNGFLTIPNFVLLPDEGGNRRTDIDIIGVRFPHRAELLRDPMQDDDVFVAITDRPFVVFVEIKSGRCEVNRSLRNPADQNIHRLLKAVGVFPLNAIDEIAKAIYETGGYTSDSYHLALCCLGDSNNDLLATRYSEVRQVLWGDIFQFIYNRFQKYRSRKYDHTQWDSAGKVLWNASAQSGNANEFADLVRTLWRISGSA